MNWLDWLFLIIIVLSAVKGFKSGFLAGVAGIVSLLGGVWLAVNYHRLIAEYLAAEWGWNQKISNFLFSHVNQGFQIAADSVLNVIAFILIVIITYIVAGGVMRVIAHTVSGTILSPIDRLGGLLLGLVKGGVFAVITLLFLVTINTPFSIFLNRENDGFLNLAIQKSQVVPIIMNLIHYLNFPLPFLNTNIV